MKRYVFFAVVILMALMIACGGGSSDGATKAKGEAIIVASFLDALTQKGDLNAAYNLLCGMDKMFLGEKQGFYDFMTGKETEAVPEKWRLMRYMISEMVPIPSNVFSYEVGDPVGAGDSLIIPVTLIVPKDNIWKYIEEKMDKDLYKRWENLEQEDISYAAKKQVAKEAFKNIKDILKDADFEMESQSVEFPMIKENGKYKISLLESSIMNMFDMGF